MSMKKNPHRKPPQVIFPTVASEPRPVRLPEATRRFAWESLNAKYGRETETTPGVPMDDVAGLREMPPLDRYDLAIRRIAEKAPLRLCDGERITGAATLGVAIDHSVPALFSGGGFDMNSWDAVKAEWHGEPMFSGVSHHTADFPTVLRRGLDGIRADVEASLSRHADDPARRRFLESCLSVLDSFRIWHGRYLDALKDRPEFAVNREAMIHVPFAPARSFHEAVQSLWSTFAFLRLCGNWPGFGRIDQMLGPYLDADLASGRITLDDARDLLAHFFIKGCEWIRGGVRGSGDAQHYQNIVLAGIDADGREVANAVTDLVLDVVEELSISDFPISIRLNRDTPERLLRHAAEVVRHGGGIVAFYGETSVIRSLVAYGYEESEARQFANDGCWEIQVPGRTYFSYVPFDALFVLQHRTLRDYAPDVSFGSFDALLDAFVADLAAEVREICTGLRTNFFRQDDPFSFAPQRPCTAVSLFEGGCIESGRSYLEGGPRYEVVSPHAGGLPDVVDSLFAIKRLVFDRRLTSFAELMTALRDDWAGREPLRRAALGLHGYWGNDDDECDAIAARVLRDFAAACRAYEGSCGYMFPPGISTFGRQLEWAKHRLATPHGRHAHDVLAPNFSPTPGTDARGATAIIRSYCKAGLSEMVTGAALDLRLYPRDMEGEDGIAAFVSLMRGFEALGGCFVQPDVADVAILRRAQEHPEEYPTLSVRVSGWNARFVSLCREWQDMIIDAKR